LGKREAPCRGSLGLVGRLWAGEPDARSRCQLLPNLVLTLGPLKLRPMTRTASWAPSPHLLTWRPGGRSGG